MAKNFMKVNKGINLRGQTSAPTSPENGDVWYDSTADKIKVQQQSAEQEVTTASNSQALTNKTIDGDLNTIQDVPITALKTELADANKFISRDGSGAVVDTKAVPTGDVVGTSDSQALTNKTIDGDLNTVQDLPITALKTDAGAASTFISRDGSGVPISTKAVPTGSVVGTTDTQTLTNKTVDDALTAKQVATPSNPAANYNKLYFKNDNKLYKLTSAGTETEVGSGGGSGVNYIAANDGAVTTGWTTFNDPTNYTDGTGGSPTATWTSSTSSPLRGASSFLFTTGGAGDGASFDFVVDAADAPKMMTISFDYIPVTPASLITGDFEIWIYDVTNAVKIQPSSYQLGATSLPSYFQAQFQTASNSTSYRLSIYQKDGTTSNVKFDNIVVGPSVKSIGAIITNPVAYTPTLSAETGSVTNATASAFWRRVGNEIEIYGEVAFTNTSSAFTGLLVSYPSGIVLDTVNYQANASDNGRVRIKDAGVILYAGSAIGLPANTGKFRLNCFVTNTSDAGSSTDPTIETIITNIFPITFNNTDTIEFNIKVPVLGWSSGSIASENTSQREIVARAIRVTSDQTITAGSDATVVFNSQTGCVDTVAGFNTSTGKYTVKVAGRYRVSYGIRILCGATAPSTMYTGVLLNAATTRYYAVWQQDDLANSKRYTAIGHSVIDCVAGDTLECVINCTTQNVTVLSAGAGTSDTTYFVVERMSGPEQILASEKIVCSRTTVSNSIANTSVTKVSFATSVINTHGCWDGTNHRFIAPRKDDFIVTCHLEFLSSATNAVSRGIRIVKNGTTIAKQTYRDSSSLTYNGGYVDRSNMHISGIISMNQGDYIEIFVEHYSEDGLSVPLNSAPESNTLWISSIGGV